MDIPIRIVLSGLGMEQRPCAEQAMDGELDIVVEQGICFAIFA